MFGDKKISLDKDLWERVKRFAALAGYSSADEFVAHVLEKELAGLRASFGSRLYADHVPEADEPRRILGPGDLEEFVRDALPKLPELDRLLLDAACGERLVEADLVGRQRLHLHDLVHGVCTGELDDDRVRLRRIASPVHLGARCLGCALELQQVLVEPGEHVRLDCAPGLTQFLPVR